MRLTVLSLALTATAVQAVDSLVDLGYAKYQGMTLANGVQQWLSVRFAAAPIGKNRFVYPQPPTPMKEVQDATKEGVLCVSAHNQPGNQYGSPRQPMDEDCLFLGIYAPKNATATSKLPVMFYIQGGGFSADSNGNFNGTSLVEKGDIVVVRTNYRVGILGFIASTAVLNDKNGAAINNGMNDIVAALNWTQSHIAAFGGDPKHVVLTGSSAGANAIDLLLTANNGTGFPGLYVGTAAESDGWGADAYIADREDEYQRNVKATGCASDPDPLNCMRALDISKFQNLTTSDGWGPTVDPTGRWLVAPHYEMFEQGRFQKLPAIYGHTSNEGTPSYLSNNSATTDADLTNNVKNAVGPSFTDEQAAAILKAYPPSLNNISFFGRDVSESGSKDVAARRKSGGTGVQWQRDAAIQGELKLTCPTMWKSDMHAASRNKANWHYRYNVLDLSMGGLRDQGIFSPHTSELYAIWGPNNTDGNDPKCYTVPAAQGGCADIVPIVQGYWLSFIKTLDPNKLRLSGTPEWKPWDVDGAERIVFDNGNASMEATGEGMGELEPAGMNQRHRCISITMPISKAINAGLKKGQTLLPFANGTAKDVTLTAKGITGKGPSVVTVGKREANGIELLANYKAFRA